MKTRNSRLEADFPLEGTDPPEDHDTLRTPPLSSIPSTPEVANDGCANRLLPRDPKLPTFIDTEIPCNK